jgi:hypothetical protein
MSISKQLPDVNVLLVDKDGRLNDIWRRFFLNFTNAALETIITADIVDHAVTYAKIQNVSANKILGALITGTVTEIDCTSVGRALLAAATAAAQRTALGLGTAATQDSSAFLSAGSAGNFLAVANNLSDVANAATAATNLGLGTASTPTFAGETLNGNLTLNTAGNKVKIKEGTNAAMGQSTLAAGTVAVSNTSVSANSRIFLSRATTGGTAGHLSYTSIANTSFTINSSSATDTSVINWLIIDAA